MPPKARLHKSSGKSLAKIGSKPSTSSSLEEAPIMMSPEVQQQFELELCWCIQQLQTALKSGKLNEKQIQDHTKALNTLMSNSAPIVKKRQIMRLSFGDYREKMKAEEKKNLKNTTSMKVKPAVPSKNSVFLKKSHFTSENGNQFRFNFKVPEKDELIEELSNVKIENESKEEVKCSYVPSDNSFRFNFNVNEKGDL